MLESTFWLLLASIIPSWVMAAEQELTTRWASRGYTGTLQDIRYLGILEGSFGKESEKWLNTVKEVTLHDAVFFLPGRKMPNDLKGWLWKNGHLLTSKPQLIHAVVGQWSELSEAGRKQIADASQLSANHIGLLVSYGQQVAGLKGKKLATALDALAPSEAYPELGVFGRMLETAYGSNCAEAEAWHARWEASLQIPESEAFPINGTLYSEGAYSLKFVPRNNPHRLFAGVLTNCCQHPSGEGEDAAWYAQEAPNGGLLALYKEHQMVAMSFVWHPLGDPRKVCLDNVEALSREMGDKLLSLLGRTVRFLEWDKVVVGGAYNDFSLDLPRAKNHLQIPDDLGYSDAECEQLDFNWKLLRFPAYFSRLKYAGCYLAEGQELVEVSDAAVDRYTKRALFFRTARLFPADQGWEFGDYYSLLKGEKAGQTVYRGFAQVRVELNSLIVEEADNDFECALPSTFEDAVSALWARTPDEATLLHPSVEDVDLNEWVDYFTWKTGVLPRQLFTDGHKTFILHGWGRRHLRIKFKPNRYPCLTWFIN